MSLTVQRATEDDVPDIVPCAAEFCATLQQPFNAGHYQTCWRNLLTGGKALLLLLRDEQWRVAGGLGGAAMPELLSGELMACELFWYVTPEHRGNRAALRLLPAFEAWARSLDCRKLTMIYMHRSMPEKLAQYYERQGYTKLETVYQKSLWP